MDHTTPHAPYGERQARFAAAVELPMLLLAVAFVPVALLPLVVALPRSADSALTAASWMIWAAFAFELTANVYLAERRLLYLRRHWFDVALVALPFLRPLRAARLFRLVRVARALAGGAKVAHSLRRVFTGHGLHYLLLIALVLVVLAATATTYFERGSGGSISSFADAIWWAMTTVTTVGYGDTYPLTAEGRAIGVFLMLLGIGVFGALTASIAAMFVTEQEVEEPTIAMLRSDVARLEAKVDELLRERR